MTKIQGVNDKINNVLAFEHKNKRVQHKTTVLNAKNTGYLAAAGVALSTLRYFSKSKSVAKTHKFLGLISVGLTLLHIRSVEYLRHKYKKM